MNGSLPGSTVHGIFQARILEWAAISFSRGTSQPRDRTWVSCITDRRFTIWATWETQESSNYRTIALISHASKVMFKILQAKLHQYVNYEIPYVQTGFGKGRGTRDQIVNFCLIIEKAREFQENIYFCFIDYAKAFGCVDRKKLENSERHGNTRPSDIPLEKSVCRSGSNSYNCTWNNRLVPNRKRSTSRLYIVTLLI